MSPSVAALVPVVDAVVAVPVAELCEAELQVSIRAVARERERLDGWLSAASGQLNASTGGRVPTEDGGGRSVAGWLAEATRTSSSAAGARLRTSDALRDLPLVVRAVLDGVLSQEQAAVLARLIGKIPLEHLLEVQAQLVEVAAGRDPVQLAMYVRHLIATHCEPQLDADEAAAHDARYLQTSRGTDGSVKGRFRLAPGDAEAVLTALEALSRKQGDQDSRSAGQRRADALTELADRALRHEELPDHGGHRPHLSYVLPADWAARQAERDSCPTCTRCPQHRPRGFADTVLGSLPGMPCVPAEQACAVAAWTGPATRARIEALLCEARISRVLLDDVGQVTGLQPLRDSVTKAQRRALAARDGGCSARGCTRPPAMCDAHHLTARAEGGGTDLGNLVLLCRRHHVLWHLGKITYADLHIPWHASARSHAPPAT
jgi:hypothetical protein